MKKIIVYLLIISTLIVFTGCSEVYSEHALKVGKNEEYQTIQSAIDASSFSGQHIIIASGTYEEDLVISKSVQLVGKSNSVVVNGTATITTSGVGIKKVVFDGKSEIENGIIIDASQDIDSLFLENTTIQNYVADGMMSTSSKLTKNKFEHLTMINCRFRKNKGSGLSCDNLSLARLIECDFENNSTGFNLQLAGGEYKAITIADCEFRCNGEKTDGCALKLALRGQNGDDSHSQASYDGYITIDNCLFQSNANGIENGIDGIENSQINYEILNTRGLLPSENDFSALQ